jgi:hypothetical protein
MDLYSFGHPLMKINLNLLKNYQQGIVMAIGYVLVAVTAFASGRIYANQTRRPDVRVEEVFSLPINDNQNKTLAQSGGGKLLSGAFMPTHGDCQDKIKGNIGSKDSRIYHVPGGSFYQRVAPELCFVDEQAAIAAGFSKSPK